MSPKKSIRSYAKDKGMNRNTIRRKLRKAGLTGPVDPTLADKLIDAGTSARFKGEGGDDSEGSYNEGERRLKMAKARQEEIKLELLEGSLVRKDDVLREYFNVGRQIRDGLSNIAARISGLVAAESDQQRCHAIIDKEIRQVLEGLTGGASGNV